MAEGAKFDGDKPRFDLLWDGMPNALLGVVKVLTFGAKKYSDHSWQNVPDAIRRYSAANLRHQNAIARGETHDLNEHGLTDENHSGLPHDFHIACNSLFLAELRERERVQRSDHSSAGHGQPVQSTDPVQGSARELITGEPYASVPDGAEGLRRAFDLKAKEVEKNASRCEYLGHVWEWRGESTTRTCGRCGTLTNVMDIK